MTRGLDGEWIAAALIRAMGMMVILLLAAIVGDILLSGISGLEPSFLLHDPTDAGRGGGIRSVLVSTALILTVFLVIATPIGLLAGIFLADTAQRSARLRRPVRIGLDTLAGVPSIVFGLFGNAVFTEFFGLRLSILAGGLTLAVMVLPFLIRSVEESLRAVPAELARAGAALGLRRTTLLGRILLPMALPGLASGLLLGTGRALAETAALLFTSGYALRMPQAITDPGRSLSIHILDLAFNVPGGTLNAYRSAAVLLVVLLILNSSVMLLARRRRAGAS